MRKLGRLVGISLLIVSAAAVCWAGETPGSGLPSPPPPPAEGTNLVTSQTPPTSEATSNSTALVNLLASWLIESLL